MRNSEVVIGGKYVAKVAGKITIIKILGEGYPKGWVMKNLNMGREVHCKTGKRLWSKATDRDLAVYLKDSQKTI